MTDQEKIVESLLERAKEYGKISFELIKLKVLDKVSEVVSILVSNIITFVLAASFFLFINIGLAFWLGEILGETFYGFIVVASFYGFLAIFMLVFMHKWLKKKTYEYIIKQATK
jgi:uncharacterized membrane protein